MKRRRVKGILDFSNLLILPQEGIQEGDTLRTPKGLKVKVLGSFPYQGRTVYRTNYGLFYEEELKA